MKYDILLTGVGGQGVLSLAAIIAHGAMKENLFVRQSEVHGMAQRGGSVISHLRISDTKISCDLIGRGTANMILGMEPLEALRYTEMLNTHGVVVTSKEPLVNISDYPELDTILSALNELKQTKVIDTKDLAQKAGSLKAGNMALVGGAAEFLPIKKETLLDSISELFSRKGDDVISINQKAFSLGSEA